MKKFRVVFASFDGICGGDTRLPIDEAVMEIHNSKGWDSIDQLRKSIKAWAERSKAGEIFKTHGSVVVAANR